MGEKWKQWQILFSWAPKSLWMVTAATKFKDACSLEEKLRQTSTAYIKQKYHLADKCPYSDSYGFSSSHVRVWKLDHKEAWALKNWSFQTMVLEKTLESPLDSKRIKSVNPKGNQPWIFAGRTDAEAPILWSPDAKSWLFWKKPDAGKDWGQKEKGTTEDEMVGWHYWPSGHEFEQTETVKDREAWHTAVHGVTKSWTRLSNKRTITTNSFQRCGRGRFACHRILCGCTCRLLGAEHQPVNQGEGKA